MQVDPSWLTLLRRRRHRLSLPISAVYTKRKHVPHQTPTVATGRPGKATILKPATAEALPQEFNASRSYSGLASVSLTQAPPASRLKCSNGWLAKTLVTTQGF